MARTDNLSNFLTDVANAIRSKTGETGEILASEFDNKIESIQSGGTDISEYFKDTVAASNSSNFGWITTVKKILPQLNINTNGLAYFFAYYPNISIPKLNFTTNIKAMSYMFYSSKLMNINFTQFAEGINTNEVTDINHMFYNCSMLFNLNISNLDTSNVTNMSDVFSSCPLLGSLDLSNWNTSNVTNMSYMFYNCMTLGTINFGNNFDTSNVTTMVQMFGKTDSLTTIPKLKANKVITIGNFLFSSTYPGNGLTNFGGLENLGMAYSTTQSANYANYRLDLSSCRSLTHESLMNVINNLYDIATKGCNAQALQLGTTNKEKLTDEEIAIATSKGWTVY